MLITMFTILCSLISSLVVAFPVSSTEKKKKSPIKDKDSLFGPQLLFSNSS